MGSCMAKVVEDSDEEVVFLASGDLSHWGLLPLMVLTASMNADLNLMAGSWII